LRACYRLVARYGMSDLIYNHITAKVPGSDGHFLINPVRAALHRDDASCFYTLDWDGNIVRQPDTEFPINRAGYLIHSAIHKARKDLECVMHTHTRGRHGGLGDEGRSCCR
jgi:ribulose-5-phosphate 4-epimerase/fuculose-1-phosphate aldolase